VEILQEILWINKTDR